MGDRYDMKLPRRWLQSNWVEHYCTVQYSDGGDPTLSRSPVKDPDLFLWIKGVHYPQLTAKQYRQAVRDMCKDKRPGYKESPLTDELRKLLKKQMDELHRLPWAHQRYIPPVVDVDDAIGDFAVGIGVDCDDAISAPDAGIGVGLQQHQQHQQQKEPNGYITGRNVSHAAPIFSDIQSQFNQTTNANIVRRGNSSSNSSNSSSQTRQHFMEPLPKRMAMRNIMTSEAVTPSKGTVTSATTKDVDLGSNASSICEVGFRASANSVGHAASRVTDVNLDSAEKSYNNMNTNNINFKKKEKKKKHDSNRTHNGISNNSATINNNNSGEIANSVYDYRDAFEPRTHSPNNGSEDWSDDEIESNAAVDGIDYSILNVLEDYDEIDNQEVVGTLEIGRLFISAISQYKVVSDVVIDNKQGYHAIEEFYTSCFKYPELMGFAIVPKRHVVDYSPFPYANDQFIKLIGKDVTKEFHQAYTLEATTYGAAFLENCVKLGVEPWAIRTLVNLPFHCFEENGAKCIRYFDAWEITEMFDDRVFMIMLSKAGENTLLHQPGPFRPTSQ